MDQDLIKGFRALGVNIPKILLPKPEINLSQWSVVACDQFTSEPEYWQKVESLVGDSSSTLRLTFPEIYLENKNSEDRIKNINETMANYLSNGVLEEKPEGFIYVERTTNGRTRKGLLLALDLDCYDYNKGSQTLIRATEGTVLSRIPPRVKIRESAPIELPHILMLVDDPQKKVIEPLGQKKNTLKKLYDFDLMMDGGKIEGYEVEREDDLLGVLGGLGDLGNELIFQRKYGVGEDKSVLLFAAGDGNHSLATAKTVWESLKPGLSEAEKENHPARFALVEVVNVHDEGLVFEPIHRVVFGVDPKELIRSLGEVRDVGVVGSDNTVRFVTEKSEGFIKLKENSQNLPVGNLQKSLDEYVKNHPEVKIDYVHGDDVVNRLGRQPGNIGFFLPVMDKKDLFRTVILDGALPRKTFSMGEANEKRYYLEARKIC